MVIRAQFWYKRRVRKTFIRSCGHSETAQFFGTLTLTDRIKQEEGVLCAACKKRQIEDQQKRRVEQKAAADASKKHPSAV
jgi:hypothetical protein